MFSVNYHIFTIRHKSSSNLFSYTSCGLDRVFARTLTDPGSVLLVCSSPAQEFEQLEATWQSETRELTQLVERLKEENCQLKEAIKEKKERHDSISQLRQLSEFYDHLFQSHCSQC